MNTIDLQTRGKGIGWAVVLVLITLAAYWPAMMNAGFIWDDDDYLTKNATLNAPGALAKIWFERKASPQYYPLVFTTFWVEKQVWGLEPRGYHVVNVLLHALSAVLVWRILKRLEVPGALLAAAIFAVHPVMVESVAWITERKNVLAGVFFCASLLAYLKFALPVGGREESRKWWWYGGALGLFVCALLSKSVACALPAVVLVLLWWKKPRVTWRDVGLTVPFFVLGLAAGLNTAFLEVTHVGASGAMWSYGPMERTLLAARGLWFYAGKIVWPAELVFYYPQWTPDAGAWGQYLYVAGVGAVLVTLWVLRKRIGKGPLAAVVIYAGVLFPALGYFNLYPMIFSVTADHFQYLASPALIALVAALMTLGAARMRRDLLWASWVLGVPLILVLGVRTFIQCGDYRNLETLAISVNRVSPHWNAYSWLSAVYMRQARELAEAGKEEAANRSADAAISCDGAALRLRPNYDVALYNLGGAYEFKRNYAKSAEYFRQAIAVNPLDYRFHYRLGRVLALMGDAKAAADSLGEGLRLNPSHALGHVAMASLMTDRGDEARAKAHVERALAIEPENAQGRLLLGFLRAMRGDMTSARAEFERALRAEPENMEAADSLAKALALGANATDADLQRALELSTKTVKRTRGKKLSYVDTHALVLQRMGRKDEAIKVLYLGLQGASPQDVTGRAILARRLQAFGVETQPR